MFEEGEETQEKKNSRYMNNAELIFILLVSWVCGIGLFMLLIGLYYG